MATGHDHSGSDRGLRETNGTQIADRADDIDDIVHWKGQVWVERMGAVGVAVVDDEFIVEVDESHALESDFWRRALRSGRSQQLWGSIVQRQVAVRLKVQEMVDVDGISRGSFGAAARGLLEMWCVQQGHGCARRSIGIGKVTLVSGVFYSGSGG